MTYKVFNEDLPKLLSFLKRYLLAVAALNLIWEILHMPLYEIWYQEGWGQITFAIIHCTGGDVLIALTCLVISYLIIRSISQQPQRNRTIVGLAIVLGISYTIYSEVLNVYYRESWAYADIMPVFSINNIEIGLSPLLQWLVIPPLAFLWSNRDGIKLGHK